MYFYAAWKFIEDSNGNEERSDELLRKKKGRKSSSFVKPIDLEGEE